MLKKLDYSLVISMRDSGLGLLPDGQLSRDKNLELIIQLSISRILLVY